ESPETTPDRLAETPGLRGTLFARPRHILRKHGLRAVRPGDSAVPGSEHEALQFGPASGLPGLCSVRGTPLNRRIDRPSSGPALWVSANRSIAARCHR